MYRKLSILRIDPTSMDGNYGRIHLASVGSLCLQVMGSRLIDCQRL